jgi:lipoyl-dependent peroxiredoxin
MCADRRAEATWEGDLQQGSGSVVLGSGAAGALPVTWAARTESADGMTSPEELIAAAHAGCFAMSLSGNLARKGHAPQELHVAATCTFDKRDEGWRVTRMELEVTGRVEGLDAGEFEAAAEAAKEGCPVSNALRGNVAIGLKAALA